jgi:hypothetical protein
MWRYTKSKDKAFDQRSLRLAKDARKSFPNILLKRQTKDIRYG